MDTKKIKPVKAASGAVIKTRETGIACIPTGGPPDNSL